LILMEESAGVAINHAQKEAKVSCPDGIERFKIDKHGKVKV